MIGPRNENMPQGLKDKTECGQFWSISRCMFGKNWNQTKEEMLPSSNETSG